MSQLKVKDGNTWIDIPAGGVGVPSGGNKGDILLKSSTSVDYATEWGAFESMKLLWTNPTPSLDFDPQTLTINLSGYDLFLIVYKGSASGTVHHSMICVRGLTMLLMGFRSNTIATRNVTDITDTTMRFTEGKTLSTYGSPSTTDNSSIIPLYIYGIK